MIIFNYDVKTGLELEDACAIVAEDNKETKEYVFMRTGDDIVYFEEGKNFPNVIANSPLNWNDVEVEFGVHVVRMFFDMKDVTITITI